MRQEAHLEGRSRLDDRVQCVLGYVLQAANVIVHAHGLPTSQLWLLTADLS